MDFYIGQIFEEMYPSEAAEWCNNNGKMIVELDQRGEVRRFQIKEIPAPSRAEEINCRIAQLQQEIDKMDYKQFKYIRGEYTEDEWEVIKADIQTRTAEINKLEKELATLN